MGGKRKQLTEREAWLYLARQWDKARLRSGFYMVRFDNRDARGLCASVCCGWLTGLWGQEVKYAMDWKMASQAPAEGVPLGHWPLTRAGAKQRAAFCRRMARLCAKEETGALHK